MSPPPPHRPGKAARPLAAMLWMLLAGSLFTFVNVIVKHVGRDIPVAQTVFLRYALGLVFVLPMLPAMVRAGFGRQLVAGFAVRGLVHSLAVLFWFHAMVQITLGEVTAIGYLQPVYIAIGAALFLGEALALRRIMAILFAIAGALIVLRPGFRDLTEGHLAMLVVSPLMAGSYLFAKRLTELTSPAATVGWMSVTVAAILTPAAWLVWEPVGRVEIGWLFLTATFATAGHFSMMLAFRAAPITVTQPVTFLQLIWSVLAGLFLFGEPVDIWVILGGTLILAAVLFIAWREARLSRRIARPLPVTPAP